jgi:DNA-binding transcriptional LysR family regulator
MGIKPSDINTVMTSANTDLIIEAVEKGLGTACISKWAVRKKLKKGALVPIQFGYGPVSRDFLIIRLDQELYTHVAQTFLNFLQESPPPSAP